MSMGILNEIFNVPGRDEEDLHIIKEAPDDEEPSGGADAPADDNAGDNADNNAEDAPQDQNTEDQNGENQDNDDQQEDNFDINTDDTDGGDEGGDQEGQNNQQVTDAGGGANQNGDAEEEASEETKNLKDKYDQLYKDLTPEERAYRDMVLKQEYKELHRLCSSIIVQVGYFPNTLDTQPLLKRIIKSLHSFKEYISFYLTDIYSTKSFFENKYQFEVYLQIFNGIKSIFKDLEKMMSHEDEDSKDAK